MRLVWTAPLLALTLAGCGAVGAIGFPLGGGEQAPANAAQATAMPTDLTAGAAPTEPVQTAALPPAEGYDPGPVAPTTTAAAPPTTPPAAGNPGQVAALAPAGGGAMIGRTDLLGGWTVTMGSESCQLFMTLTAWTGGYRASTRNCNSQILASISAWDLAGEQITLTSADGTTLAQLAPAGTGRFEGQVSGGTAIAFFR